MSWDSPVLLIEDGSDKGSSRAMQPITGPSDALAALSGMKNTVDQRLALLLESTDFVPANLSGAMSHALLGGGKRIRPLFFLCMVSRADRYAAAVDIGCAIEMVHSASLILDDLPCMDDADLRRQQLTTHKAFGQSTAILAAISLLTRGINIASTVEGVSPALRAQLVTLLTKAVGHEGLAGGQELDLNGGGSKDGLAGVEQKNWLKTGALFAATAEMAGLLDNKTADQKRALASFASHIGSAFQALDDYLDLTGASVTLGKDTGKDAGKDTIASRLGPGSARAAYLEHLDRAYALLPRCGIREDAVDAMLKTIFHTQPVELVHA
jgi:geranylgeranyl diphosphate synthase type II